MAKSNSEFKSIQKKLVAAVAMVLVASIMVVSSSYAWFTLSTAPEVTGIQTSVGSNGNLEIALREGVLSGITTSPTGAAFPAANTTWGNLVDLSDSSYHMDQLALRPSRLNAVLDVENSKLGSTQVTKDNVPVWTDVSSAEDPKPTYAADEKNDPNDTAVKVGEGEDAKQQTKNGVLVWKDASGNQYAADAAYKKAEADTAVMKDAYAHEAFKFSTGGYLQTPVYGADGRISTLDASKVINGVYDTNKKAFTEVTNRWGVRAVGVSSSMSPEALALRNAKQKVNNAISSAKTTATVSLRDDSVKMADIIIANVLNSSTTFGSTEVNNIRNAVKNLKSASAELKAALVEAVIAVGVMQGLEITAEQVDFTKDDLTVDAVTLPWTRADDDKTENVDEFFNLTAQKADLVKAYGKLTTIDNAIKAAETALASEALKATSGISFNDISQPLLSLLSTDNIEIIDSKTGTTYPIETKTVDGKTIEGFKQYADRSPFGAVSVITGKPTISIVSGIYYYIAEFCGNYSATTSMTITGSYGGVTLDNETIEVVMATNAAATNAESLPNGFHLPYVVNWMGTLAVTGGSGSASLITDIYGYAVDLAFRTNAAGSSLLLQTSAANRVDDSTATQGGGSYMEFTSGHLDFSLVQVANLMQSIRVVFMNDNGTIYGVAALQVKLVPKMNGDQKVLAEEGWPFYYEETEGTAAAPVTKKYAYDLVGAELTNGGTSIKSPLVMMNFSVDASTGVLTLNGEKSNAAITELPQNTAIGVSALVYLDGDTVENADVAISGNSMTGTMNLQFASDAELDPMDYTYQPTDKPTSVTVDPTTGKLSIPAVTGATEYSVYAKSVETGSVAKKVGTIKVAAGDTDITGNLNDFLYEPGEYIISVIAKAPNKADSEAVVATQHFTVLPKLGAPTISYDASTKLLTINNVANATSYNVFVNGAATPVNATIGQTPDITTYRLSALTAGDYTITVVATANNYADSPASNTVTFTVPAAD